MISNEVYWNMRGYSDVGDTPRPNRRSRFRRSVRGGATAGSELEINP